MRNYFQINFNKKVCSDYKLLFSVNNYSRETAKKKKTRIKEVIGINDYR